MTFINMIVYKYFVSYSVEMEERGGIIILLPRRTRRPRQLITEVRQSFQLITEVKQSCQLITEVKQSCQLSQR
jgi:hypothetical protein